MQARHKPLTNTCVLPCWLADLFQDGAFATPIPGVNNTLIFSAGDSRSSENIGKWRAWLQAGCVWGPLASLSRSGVRSSPG